MKGYKGFDKDLKCRGMQYEIGKTFTHQGTTYLCHSGLHFTEHPLDTWNYYKPNESRYAEVEAEGVSEKTSDDSKRVAQSLTVKAENKIPAMLKAAVEFVFAKAKSSPTVNATTGNYAHSAVAGENSIAASLGYRGEAKGAKGCFLVLAEYNDDGSIRAVGVAQVRGKIKPDTFYQLKDGKFVER